VVIRKKDGCFLFILLHFSFSDSFFDFFDDEESSSLREFLAFNPSFSFFAL